jgi:hypothetical protein
MCVCRFTKMFDENTTCLYLYSIAMRWLAVRIDTLAGNIYTLECKADLKVFIPILLSYQWYVIHAFAIWISAWGCLVVDWKPILYFTVWFGGRIVGIVCELGSWGIEILLSAGTRDVFLLHSMRTSSSIHTALCQTGTSSLTPGPEAAHSLPSGVGIKNAQTCIFLPYALGTWSLMKHRDNFTLSFDPHNVVQQSNRAPLPST